VAVQDPTSRRRAIANINSLCAIATVLFQLTLTGRLLATLGIAVALCASPLAALLGMVTIASHPTPTVVAICEAVAQSRELCADEAWARNTYLRS